MQLIIILLVAVSALTILSGLSTLFGSRKQNRAAAIWFFVVTIGLMIWSVSIATFLSLPQGELDTARVLIVGIIAGITIADMGLLGYTGWKYKLGRISLVILSVVGCFVVGTLISDPSVFYSNISLNNNCNQIEVVKGWYYTALIVYYTINTFTFLGFLFWTIRKTANKNLKVGLKVFYVGLMIAGLLALFFDLILLSGMPETIWVGPMATSIVMLCYYYSVVKYKIISLSSKWMKIMSNMILIMTGIIIYMIIFYVVFMALFRIPNPSPAVLILNLVMVAILLLLLPAIREVASFLKSMTSSGVEFEYVIRKISKIDKKHLNLKELAGFLADSMHYSYVLFLINGRVYGSSNVKLGADEIIKIERTKAPVNGIWQNISEENQKILDEYEVSRIGVLVGNNGQPFGQVVFGKKLNKLELSRKDLIEYETIINLSAMVIEDGGGSKS